MACLWLHLYSSICILLLHSSWKSKFPPDLDRSKVHMWTTVTTRHVSNANRINNTILLATFSFPLSGVTCCRSKHLWISGICRHAAILNFCWVVWLQPNDSTDEGLLIAKRDFLTSAFPFQTSTNIFNCPQLKIWIASYSSKDTKLHGS